MVSGQTLPCLVACNSPTPSPTPAAGSPQPTPAPRPVSSPPPSTAPAAGATALQNLGIIDDPVLAGRVADVIEHPASADRPYLRHFLLSSSRGGSGHGGGGGSAGAL